VCACHFLFMPSYWGNILYDSSDIASCDLKKVVFTCVCVLLISCWRNIEMQKKENHNRNDTSIVDAGFARLPTALFKKIAEVETTVRWDEETGDFSSRRKTGSKQEADRSRPLTFDLFTSDLKQRVFTGLHLVHSCSNSPAVMNMQQKKGGWTFSAFYSAWIM